METTVALPERTPLSRRYLWSAAIIAAVLPLLLFVAVIALLASANYNFLEWME